MSSPVAYDPQEAFDATYVRINAMQQAWSIFRGLISTPGRLRTFDRAAPTVWGGIADALLRSVLLELAIVADEKGSGTGKNLSLDRLITDLSSTEDASVVDSLRRKRHDYRVKIDPIVKLRNKVYGHADLHSCLKMASLAKVTMGDIEEAIREAASILKRIGACRGVDVCDFQVERTDAELTVIDAALRTYDETQDYLGKLKQIEAERTRADGAG